MKIKILLSSALILILISSFFVASKKSEAAATDVVWGQKGASPNTVGDAILGLSLDPGDPNYIWNAGTQTKQFGSWPIFFYENAWRIEKRKRVDGTIANWTYPGTIMGSAQAVAVGSDGVYAAGDYMDHDFIHLGENDTLRIKKINMNGADVWTKDSMTSSSFLFVDPDGESGFHTVAVDATGVYAAGHVSSDNLLTAYSQWRVEKRSPVDGSLIWGKTVDPPPGVPALFPQKHLVPKAIAVSGGKVYIGGYFNDMNANQVYSWLEVRDAATGNLIKTMQGDLAANAGIRAMAIGNNTLYIGGDVYSSPMNHWIIQKRDLNTLNLIGPSVNDNYGTSSERLNSMAYANDALYVAGMTKNGSNANWRLEKRDGNDLSMISPWPVDSNVSSGSKSDEANAIAVAAGEIYAAGYQDDTSYRAELRGDTSSCEFEFSPTVSNPPKNLLENSVDNSFSLKETDQSSHILCNCPNIAINKLSGNGDILFNPNPIPGGSQSDISQPITITTPIINSCAEDFSYQASCANYKPANFDIRVIKACSVSCSPVDQKVHPGQTVSVTGSTDFPGSPFSWSIESGDEFISSSSNPQPDMLQMTINPSVTKEQVQVKVQNCCGSAECKLNIERVGWVEAQ